MVDRLPWAQEVGGSNPLAPTSITTENRSASPERSNRVAEPFSAVRTKGAQRNGGNAGLLTVANVAAHLGVCKATVYRLCETGALAHVRVLNSIRVHPDTLDAFMRGQGG